LCQSWLHIENDHPRRRCRPAAARSTSATGASSWEPKPSIIAIALDIERESYYRLERDWWTISAGEMDLIASTIGIKPNQLWFPPPAPGREVVSLDDLIEAIDDPVKQQAAISAVRGIAGR
jgi:hypothetical protein